jgi:hypothetical protein
MSTGHTSRSVAFETARHDGKRLNAARALTPVVDEIVRGVSVFRLGENGGTEGPIIPLRV